MGLGRATAFELARKKAEVIIAGRSKESCEAAVEDIAAVTKNDKVSRSLLTICYDCSYSKSKTPTGPRVQYFSGQKLKFRNFAGPRLIWPGIDRSAIWCFTVTFELWLRVCNCLILTDLINCTYFETSSKIIGL